jgi:hypothetical protein
MQMFAFEGAGMQYCFRELLNYSDWAGVFIERPSAVIRCLAAASPECPVQFYPLYTAAHEDL